MSDPEEKLLAARRQMVEQQLRRRDIDDERILAAFLETPRERFVPPQRIAEAYEDHPVPIGHGQTVSQPYIVALMIQQLAPQPSHRILDVGAGSGYQSALLARLAGHVYGLERIDALTRRAAETLEALELTNVTIRTGDGTLGWPEEAPFDGIICGAAAPDIPPRWVGQLVDGGRIVAPAGGRDVQSLVVIEKRGPTVRRREVCDVRFVKLIGRAGWPER